MHSSVIGGPTVLRRGPALALATLLLLAHPGSSAGAQGVWLRPLVSVPLVSLFSPIQGSVGSLVTISGSSFAGATQVKFNTTPAPFVVESATTITAAVPTGATTGLIHVTTSAGTGSSFNAFTVRAASAPVITGFSPSAGLPGSTVTISGTGLTGAAVGIGGTTATVTSSSATQLTVTVPAAAHTGAVLATTSGGTAAGPEPFIVGPVITGVTPATAPLGTILQITGFNFTGATQVSIGATLTTLGGLPVTTPSTPIAFTVRSDTQIRAVVAGSTLSGPLAVTTPGGTTSTPNYAVVSTQSFTGRWEGYVLSGHGAGANGGLLTQNGTNITGTFGGVVPTWAQKVNGILTAHWVRGETTDDIRFAETSDGTQAVGVIVNTHAGGSPPDVVYLTVNRLSNTPVDPDLTAPTVTAISPAPGATGVARKNLKISITWSRQINGWGLTLTGGGQTLVSYQVIDDSSVTYDPVHHVYTLPLQSSVTLLPNTTYTVSLQDGQIDWRDPYGVPAWTNVANAYHSTFTTGP